MMMSISKERTNPILSFQSKDSMTTIVCRDAPQPRVPQVPGDKTFLPSLPKSHTYTFLEGTLQSTNHQVFRPNALFLYKLGVTGADTVTTEVHGGLSGHHAFYYGFQLLAQAGVQGVGSQDGCSWTTVPIKQCPIMTCQELYRNGSVSGSSWLPQWTPGSA